METFTEKTPQLRNDGMTQRSRALPSCGLARVLPPCSGCPGAIAMCPASQDVSREGHLPADLSSSSQMGPRTTTSESQLKTGAVSPGCRALGPQTTFMFLCMCWDDSAETSGQTDHHSNFQ